jgi:hypothetical protein
MKENHKKQMNINGKKIELKIFLKRAKRLAYRQDLFGQMNYEQRKKQEV